MFPKNYNPWVPNTIYAIAIGVGTILFATSLPIALFLFDAPLWLCFITAAVTGAAHFPAGKFAHKFNQDGKSRHDGLELEEFVHPLLKLYLPKSWQFETHVPVREYGDIDIRITTASGHSFIIDLKAYWGVAYDAAHEQLIKKSDSSHIKGNSIKRMRNCMSMDAAKVGVIWAPRARTCEFVRIDPKHHIYIANGTTEYLLKSIKKLQEESLGVKFTVTGRIPEEKKSFFDKKNLHFVGPKKWVAVVTPGEFDRGIRPELAIYPDLTITRED